MSSAGGHRGYYAATRRHGTRDWVYSHAASFVEGAFLPIDHDDEYSLFIFGAPLKEKRGRTGPAGCLATILDFLYLCVTPV